MKQSPNARHRGEVKKLNHETPLWVRESEEIFFITICCRDRGGNQLARSPIADRLVDSVVFRNESGVWWCSCFVVMPDHVHALIQFSGELPMERAVRAWKSWTAKQLGTAWQRGWFDHRLRRDESWREKAAYLLNNPVRSGLVDDAGDWAWIFSCER